jgi:DNA-binding transcriptional ArsR family regulator
MREQDLTPEALELIAARFRVLSEPMRLRILHALGDRELSVGDLVEQLEAGQANVSKHLGVLLAAGIVARRTEGLNAYYSIADGTIFRLCELVCSSIDDRLAAQRSAVIGYSKR